jgi:ABC-type uncharacterized transport system auxiliary subunit
MRLSVARRLGAVAVLSVMLGLGSCSLSRPAPLKHSYLLHATRPSTAVTAEASAPSARASTALRVNRFVVAQPFDGRPLVYRADALRFEVDFYSEYLALPATMVTERAIQWLSAARLFSAVVPMASSLDAAYVLEGAVTDLYGDFRDPAKPQAVIAIRFLLAREDAGSRVLLDRQFARAVPIGDRAAATLIEGIDRGLTEILTEAEQAIAATLPAAPRAN